MNKCGISHLPPGLYEHEVQKLADAMVQQLKDHEHLGNWNQWHPTIAEMELMLARTWQQLKIAHASENPRRCAELAADLGNFALKCHSQYGKQ